MIFSDKTITEWKEETIQRCMDKGKDIPYEMFVKWIRQENEVAVFTTYAYADFPIPKHFNCIFNFENPEIYLQTNFVLTQSIWEGWYPIDYIDHGHKHLCILKFENKVPDLLKQLHYETEKYSSWTWDAKKVLGLCQMKDIKSIIERLHEETKLKEIHGKNWHEFDEQA